MTGPPSPVEIADLIAWARRLTQAGPTADPTDRAAYLAAKASLLARIPTQAAPKPRATDNKDSR